MSLLQCGCRRANKNTVHHLDLNEISHPAHCVCSDDSPYKNTLGAYVVKLVVDSANLSGSVHKLAHS